MNFLERLGQGIVLTDGGYLLELERRGFVQAGPYTPEIALEFPDAVRSLHLEFKLAGAEVLKALTFYATEEKLRQVGYESKGDAINRAAVSLAREVAGAELFVAGTMTQNPGFLPGDSGSRDHAREIFRKQVDVQAEAGVDVIFGETFIFLEEALIALREIKRREIPALITMNIGIKGSADGVAPEKCAAALAGEGADAVGVNCSFDPYASLSIARRMRSSVKSPVACFPSGFHGADPSVPFTEWPEFPLALEKFQLSRFEMSAFARKALEAGVKLVGGCCGVAPYHVRAMAEALGRVPRASGKSPDLSRHVIEGVRKKSGISYWENLLDGDGRWDCHEESGTSS